jgi:hypothetical protein
MEAMLVRSYQPGHLHAMCRDYCIVCVLQVLFSYCPPPNLDPDYRCQLILAELAGYQADVLCLQEVDHSLFNGFLVPHLAMLGGHWGATFIVCLSICCMHMECSVLPCPIFAIVMHAAQLWCGIPLKPGLQGGQSA